MSVCGLNTSLRIKDSREVYFSGFEGGVDEGQFAGIISLKIGAEEVLFSESDRSELTVEGSSLLSIIKVVKWVPGAMSEDVAHVDLLRTYKTSQANQDN